MTPSRREAARRGLGPALAALSALLIAGTTAAEAEVVVNEDEFRDWVGRCETETTTGEVVCFIYTGRVADLDGLEIAARIVIGIGDQMDPIVYLDMPDIAEPSNGFMLQVDNNEPFSGRFSTCATGWCQTQAVGDIALELVRQFRGGAEATASFILEEQELQVDLPLSLMGFTAAYERLVTIHQQAAEAAAAAAEDAEEPAADEPGDEPADEPGEEAGAADADATDETEAGGEAGPADGADEPVADDTPAGDDEPAPDAEPEQPAPDADATGQ